MELPAPLARLVALAAAALLFSVPSTRMRAADDTPSESMADRTLRQIVQRQKDLFADAQKQGEKLDQPAFTAQIQAIVHQYELLLRDNPKFAIGYAAYGYLLRQVDMRRESEAMLLKANQLDSDIPLVKNQLGNFLAEDGKPLQAAPYFLAAIKLAPNEPLYHYELGRLLATARDDFLKSGDWTRAALDEAELKAFRRASELAPDNFEYGYQYAWSFYDVDKPDWENALKAWSALEEKASTAIERQTMRLQAANVCLKMGKPDHARVLLGTVDEPDLQTQKQKLIAQLGETTNK